MNGPRWAATAASVAALTLAGCSSAGEAADGHNAHEQAAAPVDHARRLTVEAGEMSFDPPTLRIAAGQALAISLTAADTTHDFVIDEVGFHLAADPGQIVEGALRIDEPGSYTAYCSIPGHRDAGMEATVDVIG